MRGAAVGGLILISVMLISALPVAAHPIAPALSPAGPTVAGTLVDQGFARNISNYFWGTNAQTATPTGIATDSGVGTLVNDSAVRFLRYGEGSDACDLLNNTQWSDSGSSTGGCLFDVSSLKAFCGTGSRCHTVLTLPGEINDAPLDKSIASYIVTTLGFQPTLWSIGNEPDGWKHFNKLWWNWKTTDKQSPTALEYARDVQNATAAVLTVDPTAQFVGIEASCSCNKNFFQEVASVDGPNISEIAYHQYPTTTTVTNANFLDPLDTGANVSTSYATVRADITGQCTGCSTMPISIDEYNHGPSTAAPIQDSQFLDAVYMAASIAQAEVVPVSHLTTFVLQTQSTSTTNLGFAMINANDVLDDAGTLYQNLTGSFTPGGSVYNTSIATTATNAWATMMDNAHNFTLLVANANTSDAIDLNLNGVFPTGGTGTVINWSGAASAPTKRTATIATSYTIPAEGILFLRVHNTTFVPGPKGAGMHAPLIVPSSQALSASILWMTLRRAELG